MSIALRTDIVASETESGMVLLDQHDGRYWHLNRTGAAALRLLLDGHTSTAAAYRITRDYPLDQDRARADIDALVDALCKARLAVTS